jgi:hypothetical protein
VKGEEWAAVAAAIVLMAPNWAGAQSFEIPAELWERPRTGALILAQEPLRQAVARFQANAAARLSIHHGGGDEALLQAEELRSWLLALALDGSRIELVNDLSSHVPLRVEIRP